MTPSATPRTQAGRALFDRLDGTMTLGGHDDAFRSMSEILAAILAIEAEAAALPAEPADACQHDWTASTTYQVRGMPGSVCAKCGAFPTRAEPADAGLREALAHRQSDELGHGSDGRLFHEAQCPRCGLMLAYLVRDQVECAHPTSGQGGEE